MRDELENDVRAHLNLGHTFGHAIEAAFNYNGLVLHGEAVSIGIIMAFRTSVSLGICTQREFSIVEKHFKKIGLKTNLDGLLKDKIDSDLLMRLMQRDKKVKKGSINFIIPNKIGEVSIISDIDHKIIKSVIDTTLSS
jgi:3-dehydroquinate synthase